MDESALLPHHVAHYMLDTAWSAVRVLGRSSLSAVTTDRTTGRGEGLGKSEIELRIANCELRALTRQRMSYFYQWLSSHI